jgi:hypothetical protein
VPSALTWKASHVLATGFTCVLLKIFCIYSNYFCKCRSQWPRGLRRGTAVIGLLKSGLESRQGHGCLCCDCFIRTIVWEEGMIWRYKMDQRIKTGRRKKNSSRSLDVWLLWELCVVKERFLRRADHSSSRVLPSVVCLNKWDREVWTVRRTWPTRGCRVIKKIKQKICKHKFQIVCLMKIVTDYSVVQA